MAHNPKGTRKTRSNRIEQPAKSQQVTNNEPPKEKLPRMTLPREVQGQRRGKTTSQQVLEAPTKVMVKDLHGLGVCQMVSVSKNQARAAGGGGGAMEGQKYHREPSLTPPSAKTTRSSVTTGSVQKSTPKDTKEPSENSVYKDSKTYKEFKELMDSKPYKEFKELMEAKPLKEPQAKTADKSPNASHRHSRHQVDRTKNYFDKYLKFAFDLSTPEGVKQLEAHFFPHQDPSGAGTSTNRQD